MPARAQQEPIRAQLNWMPPAPGSNCIDSQQLRQEVEQRLGRQVFTDGPGGDVRVAGGIERQQGLWQAQISLSSAGGESMGERTLESEGADCSTLDDSLALVLAVMLDIPKARVPQPTPQAMPTPAPAPPSPPVLQTRLRVPKHTPPRRPQWHFEGGLGGLAAFGLLPTVALGARAELALLPPDFPKVGVDFALYRSVDEPIEVAGAGANFGLREAGVFLCPFRTSGSLFLEACAVQHVGRLRVEGYGFDSNEIQSRAYLNVGLRGTLGIELVGPLSLRLAVGGELPVLRETFRYGSPSGSKPSLFRMAPVIGAGQIGLVAQF